MPAMQPLMEQGGPCYRSTRLAPSQSVARGKQGAAGTWRRFQLRAEKSLPPGQPPGQRRGQWVGTRAPGASAEQMSRAHLNLEQKGVLKNMGSGFPVKAPHLLLTRSSEEGLRGQ